MNTAGEQVKVDRSAAIRQALRKLVAEQGFHGASMSAVAAEAGVAVGTAYVHYKSKDELVLASYLELKRDLGHAAVAGVDPQAPAAERFRQVATGIYLYLRQEPWRARFLAQMDVSPYAPAAHARDVDAGGDPLMRMASEPDIARRLLPLPSELLWDLGIGPLVRVVASGEALGDGDLATLVTACWRAITRPG